jgi:transcriptional regulator with XRE-family HTH domain
MSRERSIQRFGEKLHTLRVSHGLTLKELAVQLGHIAHGYISELETGKKLPSVEFVLGVAYLFNVTTDQLLKDELELTPQDAANQESETQPAGFIENKGDTSH